VQAAPQQADPRCGTLSLTQAGVRASTGSDPVDVCW
jgi:Tfp pilus assembly protein PilE